MEPNLFAQTTLAILAGGEGSRMGRPKGLLEVRGRPILQYLLEQFAWPGPKWLITSPRRERPPGWENFDRELVDPETGTGPLRGILTGLEEMRTPMMVVAPVDMPMLGRDQLQELVGGLGANDSVVGVMFRRRVGGEERVEPFPIAVRCEAASGIRRRLQRMQRSVHRLLEDPEFISIPARQDWAKDIWTNLNEPGEFEAFVRKQGKQ